MTQQLVNNNYCYLCVKKFAKLEKTYNTGMGKVCYECYLKSRKKICG